MLDIKRIVSRIIAEKIDELTEDEIASMLEYPPNPDMGDIALPCFKLSRILRKSPVDIANDLSSNITEDEHIDRVEAVSGYLNFFLDKGIFIEKIVTKVTTEQERYVSSDIGKGKNIVIDYSSPNIAKPFHFGHLRSTSIGNALYNIFEFLGYNSIGINHLGDWGTQFGKLIVAYKKWGDKERIEKNGISELMDIYVKYHKEAETDPSLDDEARAWFTEMEKGNEEALELWHWFKDISLQEFARIYNILDMKFDSYAGESFYNDKMGPIVEELNEKGLLIESEGAHIVDLEKFDMPPCLILKKDGSTLYATRDIAAAKYRKETYDFEKCIYLTGADQSLHFKQFFKVIDLMGYDWADRLIHAPFGLVSVEGEKLASRAGKVILLEDVLKEAIDKTLKIIEEKNPNLENKEEIAEQMGVGAVLFSDLSSNRIKDISFSWNEMLNFDGETGPYVQYTHARACSVISRTDDDIDYTFDASHLKTSEEYNLVKRISFFPSRITEAKDALEPSIITRYLVDLAQDFNRFYHNHSILNVEDENIKKGRILLTKATKITLEIGLKLIGLKAPNRV
ncbi:MAG: arginine--tRNA ligase [Clostridiales bacterium]|nr:arginine--tRNA ligase [Clostridiales bacterium]